MRDCQKRLSTAFFDNKVPRRRRKLHILRSRLKPRAQSFRCSSSPTKCILRFVGSQRPMGTGAALRRRKLHILRSRPRPGAQSFRCSSSPTKCILRFVGSVGGRWRPALRFVVASCISFAPGQGRELSHSAAPPLPMSAIRTHWEPEVFSATYTPPPKMITVPFAPTGRETLRGFFDKLTPPSTQDGGEFFVNARAAVWFT